MKCQNSVVAAIKKHPILLGTVITFEVSMLGPKCNNGFITFRTNGLLYLGPNFITFRTFIKIKTNLVLHLGPDPYYIWDLYYI